MYLFIIHFISMTIVINEIYTFSYSHSEIKHDYRDNHNMFNLWIENNHLQYFIQMCLIT